MCEVPALLLHMQLRYAEGHLQFRCVCVGMFMSHIFLLLHSFEKNACK